DGDALTRDDEIAAGRALVHPDPPRLLNAAEPVALAIDRDAAVAHPRRRERPDLDAPDGGVDPGVLVLALEPDPVQPHPALCVLGAPVVPHHAGPAVELDGAVADRHGPAVEGGRQRAERLGARDLRAVHPVAREMKERSPVPGVPQVPGRLAGAAGYGAGAEGGACDLDEASVRQARARLGDLHRPWPGGAGVEQGEPQRALGLLTRPLVHRVADPDPERLGRVRGAQIEALVVARGVRDVGEAGA